MRKPNQTASPRHGTPSDIAETRLNVQMSEREKSHLRILGAEAGLDMSSMVRTLILRAWKARSTQAMSDAENSAHKP